MDFSKGQAKIFAVLTLAVAGVLLYAFTSGEPQNTGNDGLMENWTVTLSAGEEDETFFNYTSLPENRVGILKITKDSDSSEVTDFQSDMTWVYCGSCNLSESSYTVFYQIPSSSPGPSPDAAITPTPEPSGKAKVIVKDSFGNDVGGTVELFDFSTKRKKASGKTNENLEENAGGNFDIAIIPDGKLVERLTVENAVITEDGFELGLEDLPDADYGAPSTVEVLQAFAINLPSEGFEKAEATATAHEKANSLFKCKDWIFPERKCGGDWVRIKNLEPGKEFSIELAPGDPAFLTAYTATLYCPSFASGGAGAFVSNQTWCSWTLTRPQALDGYLVYTNYSILRSAYKIGGGTAPSNPIHIGKLDRDTTGNNGNEEIIGYTAGTPEYTDTAEDWNKTLTTTQFNKTNCATWDTGVCTWNLYLASNATCGNKGCGVNTSAMYETYGWWAWHDPPYHNGTVGGSYPAPNWYDSDSINTTAMPMNEIRSLASFWNDDTGLSHYTLEHNQSGSFANETPWTAFSQSNQTWGNKSLTIVAADEGKFISGRIWANDTGDLKNATFWLANLTVYEVAPSVTNAQQNTTSTSNTTNSNTFICVNATETDVGVGMDSGWVDVTFPNGSNYNLTLTPNSGDASDCAGGASVYDREIHVGSTGGTLTLNMFYGNDTRANIGRDDVHTSLQVTVTAAADPAELKVAQFRLWRNPTDIIGNGSVDPAVYDFLACNVSSSFGNNIGSGETCNSTSPGTAYRAEIRYCNDGPSGATPVSFTTANHISLSSQFIGSLTDCGSGDNGTSWTGTGCASYTGSDGLPVVEITGNTVIPAGDGSTRTDTNCDYYAYRFNTGNPDWIVTDITTANATGATSGSDPTSGSFNVNTTYSETAFALFYPSSGCTVGNGSEGRVRPRYYNETVDADGTCGGYEIQACDPQLAVDGGWNDSNSYAISGGSPIPGDVYYNFTGVNGEQGAVYWTYKTTGTATLNVWDWTDGRWEILDSGTDASITTRAIAIPGGQDYVSPYGALNLTQNSSDAGANNLFDVYYDGNHTDKCAKCFFTTVNPNAKNVACEGQTGGGLSGTSFFDLQNLGSVIGDWKVFIDSAMPTGIDFFINDSSSTHVTLSTTPQTFNSSIEFFEHAYAWAWANFTNVGASTNERKITSNTSWK